MVKRDGQMRSEVFSKDLVTSFNEIMAVRTDWIEGCDGMQTETEGVDRQS